MNRIFSCCFFVLVLGCTVFGSEVIDLSGRWEFALDRDGVGVDEQWYSRELTDRITLPGSLQEEGYGDKPSAETEWTSGIGVKLLSDPRFAEYIQSEDFKCPFWLTPERYYVGKAWYRRKLTVPENWKGRHIVLKLERPHWQTTVWVDTDLIGSCNSLGTAHEYDLSNFIHPGEENVITICIDNSYVVPVGKDAHSISDQTQSNWNGITGQIQLAAGPEVWIEDAQIFPDAADKLIKVNMQIRSLNGSGGEGTLTVKAESYNAAMQRKVPSVGIPMKWSKESNEISFEYDMGDDCLFWDEYQPALYKLTLSLKTGGVESIKEVKFGMRQLGIRDKQFTINDRKIFLRGTLECCIFPLHGYPPTNVNEWKRIIDIAKSHGLNHFRFHSWCPPEEAFAAADEEGFYLQVEGSCWAAFGDGTTLDEWIYKEIDRMIKAYGNHPSFCFFSPSNEPSGRNREEFLGKLLRSLKEKDNRRFYVAGAGWPQIEENQYSIEQAVRLQRWKTLKFDQPPQTYDDYHEHVEARPVPVVGHEIGQWCVYPDLDEDKQYTGVLKAKNIEIFGDKLQKAGMGGLAHDFLMASGKFQTLLYKQEIEAALRTPNFAGFQLLDLHDFPGQGTAPVGVLNSLWQSKGYVTPEQYRRFCNDIVPLARMKKRIFTNDTSFECIVDLANYSSGDLSDVTLNWKITNDDGSVFKAGSFLTESIPMGGLTRIGSIEVPLGNIEEACRLNLEIELADLPYANDWDFWVYPSVLPSLNTGDIYINDKCDKQLKDKLDSGVKALLIVPKTGKAGEHDTLGTFRPIFWNRITFPSQPVHTLGILCDANHPSLAEFPAEFHSNWQWQDLLDNSRPLVLDELPNEIQPVIQPIDDWNNCRKLGLLFEASVGGGKLLVCSIDIQSDLDNRITARQLRYSLLKYMESQQFNTRIELSFDQLEKILR